jgi:ABC-type cobalamin/Fe3+-siderophores transport system ATPase subunit
MICGVMMFEGDDALKKIKVLSGGEKSRVLLGKLIAAPLNLLLLDEPNNHLDMESSDALLTAIDNFDGAVVMVTHNEMFLHALAERLIVFQDEGVSVFEGSYERFLERVGWKGEEDRPRGKRKAEAEEDVGEPGEERAETRAEEKAEEKAEARAEAKAKAGQKLTERGEEERRGQPGENEIARKILGEAYGGKRGDEGAHARAQAGAYLNVKGQTQVSTQVRAPALQPEKVGKKEMRRLRSEVVAEKGKVLKPLEQKIAVLEKAIEKTEADLSRMNHEIVEASKAKASAKIIELSKAIHELRQNEDAFLQELEPLLREYEAKKAEFDKKMEEL